MLVLTKTSQSVKPSSCSGSEFAVPGIPTSRNQLQLRERRAKDTKRQRRTPPPLPAVSSCYTTQELSDLLQVVLTTHGKTDRQPPGVRQRSKHSSGSKSN